MSSIILLSGPVGSGKSTVARELVAASSGLVAYIEGDIFWTFIAKAPATRSRRENFLMIMRAMTRAALIYARDGFEVILDFSVPPAFLDAVRERVKDVPIDFVVLLPSEATCAARAAARREGAISDYGPYHQLYLAFGEVTDSAIRDEDTDPASTAERIRDGINAGKFRLSP